MPILLDIEIVVLDLAGEYPKMTDKDIEYCYTKLKDHYRKLAHGGTSQEPMSASESKQALLDEILNCLDEREEEELDLVLINNPEADSIYRSLQEVYVSCFNHLIKSVRFWRKEKGGPSYLSYVRKQIDSIE